MTDTAPDTEVVSGDWVEDLVAADDEAFKDFVDDDLREDGPAGLHAALRDPRVVSRFFAQLQGIASKVASDLSYRGAECEAAQAELDKVEDRQDVSEAKLSDLRIRASALWAEFDAWRPGAIRFKGIVDRTISQVRPLHTDALRSKIHPDTIKILQRRINKLEAAIRAHRTNHHGRKPSTADQALWKMVPKEPRAE